MMEIVSGEKKPHRSWKDLVQVLVKGTGSGLDLLDRNYEEVVKRDLLQLLWHHHNQNYRLEGVIEGMITLEN